MKKLRPYLKNRYVYTPLALLVWLFFFDSNDLISEFSLRWQIHQTNQQIDSYHQEIKETNRQIKELTTNVRSLEKFAREQYHMKRDNEDVFVIVDDDKQNQKSE